MTARRLGNPVQPTSVLLQLVFLYVLLLSFAFAFESGLFKLGSGLLAIWVFAVMLVNTLFIQARHVAQAPGGLGLLLGFALFFTGMGANLLFAHAATDLTEWMKIFMAPAFMAFGYVLAGEDPQRAWTSSFNRLLFLLMVLLPLVVWAWQLGTGRTSLGGSQVVGMFGNRNNAALYYLTLIAFYGALSGREVGNVLVYVLAGVAFGTLGVLLAVLLSLLLAVGHRRYFGRLMFTLALMAFAVWLLPERLVLDRLRPVLDSYRLLADERINLSTVSYGELVSKLGTSDLSFIFRLKHWLDLLSLYADGDGYQMMLGRGVGAAARLSEIRLVPHNDYLRLLFECGPASLLGLLLLLATALKDIGRRWAAVPLLAVCIYFFSENLINNFLAMVLFFFSLGVSLLRARVERRQRDLP